MCCINCSLLSGFKIGLDQEWPWPLAGAAPGHWRHRAGGKEGRQEKEQEQEND